MRYENLIEGRLLRRYKRFLADIRLPDGTEVTVHCPNTGSMKRCDQANSRVWLQRSNNLKRKYPLTWELVEVDETFLSCINTQRANGLVEDAINGGVISELQGYSSLRREVKYHENSRIDILLSGGGAPDAYIEVKNLTFLLANADEAGKSRGLGVFPDAVTTRGAKHLEALMAMKAEGYRAVLMFCVAHEGIRIVSVADDIDPEYGRLLREAMVQGVEVLAYAASISPTHMSLSHALPVHIP